MPAARIRDRCTLVWLIPVVACTMPAWLAAADSLTSDKSTSAIPANSLSAPEGLTCAHLAHSEEVRHHRLVNCISQNIHNLAECCHQTWNKCCPLQTTHKMSNEKQSQKSITDPHSKDTNLNRVSHCNYMHCGTILTRASKLSMLKSSSHSLNRRITRLTNSTCTTCSTILLQLQNRDSYLSRDLFERFGKVADGTNRD